MMRVSNEGEAFDCGALCAYGAMEFVGTCSPDYVRYGELHPGLFSNPPSGRKCRARTDEAQR
jgi:hypothetical protein